MPQASTRQTKLCDVQLHSLVPFHFELAIKPHKPLCLVLVCSNLFGIFLKAQVLSFRSLADPTLSIISKSPQMPSVPTPSKAGIVEADGERHIPSSVRPDGSKRKEIKIRPGYKPPEDVETYKNRTADAFRNRGTGGIPGADGLKDKDEGSASSNKNAKRREARKKAKAAEDGEVKPAESSKVGEGKAPEKIEEVDPEVEREKKARTLKKKLKQAKDLKEKKDGGSALLPEQFAKVIKINELIRELDALGFDAEGEPKEKEEEKA